MKRRHFAALFFLISLLLASCSKVFTNGTPITEERNLAHRVNTIFMHNNVNVKLVKSDRPRMLLTCPENLIQKVTTEIIGDTLYIKNENSHNWLRSYDYSIDLTVYYNNLRQINYASNGKLTCIDSIKGVTELIIDNSDIGIDSSWIRTFTLNVNEGSGDIDLTFDCQVMRNRLLNGTSHVTLRGYAEYIEFTMSSYSVVHAETLNSNFVRVQSHSCNDAYVWARTKISAWLHNIGNVYYKGNPMIVQECYNEGKVIKLE